jgi:hypothetical protein
MMNLHYISFELSKSNWAASFGDEVFELIFETNAKRMTECNIVVTGVLLLPKTFQVKEISVQNVRQ